MWPLIHAVIVDLSTGSWTTRLSCTLLVASSLFCLGAFGGYGIQTMTSKSSIIDRPIDFSGTGSAHSTIRSLPTPANLSDSKSRSETWKQGHADSNGAGN